MYNGFYELNLKFVITYIMAARSSKPGKKVPTEVWCLHGARISRLRLHIRPSPFDSFFDVCFHK